MTGSRAEVARLLALVLAIGTACQTTAPTSGFPLLGPTALPEPVPATPLDQAVAQLAEAALAGGPKQIDLALAHVEELYDDEAKTNTRGEDHAVPEGLLPLAIDLRNATLDDAVAYREAAGELLASSSLEPDPALEARLEQAVADDPLTLASLRTRDHWQSVWASTFNAVVEPLGGSLMWGLAVAPFRLATRLTHYAADMYSRPEMSLQERQALAHRQQYVLRHPDAPDAEAVRRKVEEGQQSLDEMQTERYIEFAESSLAARRYRLAEVQADRVLGIDPKHEGATTLRAIAQQKRDQVTELRERGEQASETIPADLALLPVLEALLTSSNLAQTAFARAANMEQAGRRERTRLEDLIDEVRILQAADPGGDLADEFSYVLALAQYDLGFENQSWKKLRKLGNEDPLDSNMQRHAQALLGDPWQNTYGNFVRQQQRAGSKAVGFRLFGGYSLGRQYPELPGALSFLIELPAVAQTLIMTPIRLVFGPWDPPGRDFDRASAIAGYRYLTRSPEGQHTREVATWLYDYETDRKNWVAALRLYDLQSTPDPMERLELAEKAADQQLAAAQRAGRRDWRGSILRGVVREFPDSDAGHLAGSQLREEREQVSPQRIRVTKSFLQENPRVAGPYGLALNPVLLDDDVRNGELHPKGVTFLGARMMEFSLVADSGDEDDEPVARRQAISPERLGRAVAVLNETVLLNDQIDAGDAVTPDASRDHYLERARLGLVDDPDMRASAESKYVYESLRERYGMVRGRDSILPFDLVFRGSLFDLSLGAFPRWRQPRETPDAFLYR
ncbi:MAG: hypothetical protein VX466_15910 [Myxococcota bacterium]|nr:hypothetical protein [Myxococcota bacterium]